MSTNRWLRREARYQNDHWMNITNLPRKLALVHYSTCPIAHRETTKVMMHSSTVWTAGERPLRSATEIRLRR